MQGELIDGRVFFCCLQVDGPIKRGLIRSGKAKKQQFTLLHFVIIIFRAKLV